MDSQSRILYVGKAKNLKKRVSSYFANQSNLLQKTKILVSQTEKIRYIIAGSEIEALLLEANNIKKYMPKYNSRLRDGKRYPLVRITVSDKYPKVLIARRYEEEPSGKGSLYFGPFPNSGAVRLVLRTVRRIFPFQSVINHPKKLCLYYHLGLCPCPEVVGDKEYLKNINHIVSFLKGDIKKVVKELENERRLLSKEEKFEKAQIIQQKIDAILYVTSEAFEKFDHKTNPNLESDLRNNELAILKKTFLRLNIKIKDFKRIECFDISNTSGTNSTGSMVVFTNGEKNSSQYRKFKIRNLPDFSNSPNDFAMMQQVLERRLSHKEWRFPDLIIVDGGKGQVSAALKALRTMKQFNNEVINIQLIGLAKREEIIITSDFKEIRLPKDSPALHLVQRIRDESHRFAITYHRKLRSKALFKLTSSQHHKHKGKREKKLEDRIG